MAALLGALSIACNGDSIASPSSSTPSIPPVSGDAPSTTSLAIHLGVSSRSAAVGDTIELRVEASSSSSTGLSGLSGSISFDPARLAFAQAVPAPNVILVAHEGSPGQLAVASVAAGPGTTTSVLRFAVRGAGYADSLHYRFEEAVSKKLAPITQADVHQPAVDSVPSQGLEPRSVTMATRTVALADLAQPDSTPPPPPGGYLYGDVNADGRISVLDAAIVAALAAGDTVALAYLPTAANVDPANPPGLGGADDPLPPGRNANGTYTVDLADVTAIMQKAVGLAQPIVGGVIPERRFASLVAVASNPRAVTLAPGAKKQFGVVGTYSDGGTGPITAAWSATGGKIDPTTGLFTAGSVEGTFAVIAHASIAEVADTATVTIANPAVKLVSLTIAPATADLAAGATQQFAATGRYSNGSSKAISAAWSATGGTVDATGRYTAATTGGEYRVIGAAGGLADTAAVSVSGAATPPPPTSGAWLVEDFSTYGGNTASWKADPHDWMVGASSWMHQEQIHIDTQVLYNGHPTLRYDWPGPAGGAPWGGCNTDPSITADYRGPPTRELWVEAVHQFRSDWNDRGPGCNFGEYKFLLMWRLGDRFGIGNGHDGSSWWSASPQSPVFGGYEPYCSTDGGGENCRWGYGKDQTQYLASLPDKQWDGRWHVYRAHIRIPAVKGNSDGIYEVWVDGVQTVGRYGRTFIDNSDGEFTTRITEIMLGSNSNSGTLVPTQTWWGHLKVWTSNPGW